MSEANTLNEAVESANTELTAKHESGAKTEVKESKSEPKAEKTETRQEVRNDDDDDFDAPKWTKQWKKSSRGALRRLHELAKANNAEDAFPEIYKEIETRYDYTGKTQAEFDRFRKRYEPYDNVLGSLEQRFAMQGMHPAAGLQQMAAVSDFLQRDPDQALMWLAQQFKPRDAKKLIEQLSQLGGVDLAAVSAQQPYIDPAVKGMVEPLQRQIAMMQNAEMQRRQQEYQQNAQYVANAIQAFTSAKDDNGELKYPHYWRLDKAMARVFEERGIQWAMQTPNALEELYNEALWRDPELREQAAIDRARQTEEKAIQAAKVKSAEVEEAVRASRNVNGGTNAPKQRNRKSLDEILVEVSKSLSR